jgi:hypothetical protein
MCDPQKKREAVTAAGKRSRAAYPPNRFRGREVPVPENNREGIVPGCRGNRCDLAALDSGFRGNDEEVLAIFAPGSA